MPREYYGLPPRPPNAPMICVGGPKHGETIANQGPTLEVALFTPLPPTGTYVPEATPNFPTITYRRRRLKFRNSVVDCVITCWVPQDMSEREAIRLLGTMNLQTLGVGL